MIHSDWHIHTDASYDAHLPLETLIAAAKEQGLRGFGVTDHLNYDDDKFWANLVESAENYHRLKDTFPGMRLGVELTPISKPYYDYVKQHGTRVGYVPPVGTEPFGIGMAGDKEKLKALGVQYAVGAAHWRVEVAEEMAKESVEAQIIDWHHQQMYLACDDRVTILGHPWACNDTWFEDFSIVPASMHDELAAALLENGKYAECNVGMFMAEDTAKGNFRQQYAEFLRFLFEKGIPLTYGSDCHGDLGGTYPDDRIHAWRYLEAVGFKDGDFSELSDDKLWK